MQAIVEEEKVNVNDFVKKIINREEVFMKQQCWNVNMAVNHTLKIVRSELKNYLDTNLGVVGKLDKDKIYSTSLCGMTVKNIEHIMQEMALKNNLQPLEPLSDLEMARLLQVFIFL